MEKFEDLVDKTLKDIVNIKGEELVFTLDNGEEYRLHHRQDCCESLTIEYIVGDLKDLIESPILMAEKVSNSINDNNNDEYYTWTFYKLATVKGHVTIQWYGTINGYYSESVDWCKVN